MNPYTYIYGLKDPRDNQFHYIGKSNLPKVRLTQHISKKDANIQKNLWLAELENLGMVPELVVLEKVSLIKWQVTEQKWIAKGIREGWPLTNIQAGGGGNKRLELDWTETMRYYLSDADFDLFKRLDKDTQSQIGSAVTLKMLPYTKAQLTKEGRADEYIPGREAQIGADFAAVLMESVRHS